MLCVKKNKKMLITKKENMVDKVKWFMSDLIIEDTIDQEDEGSLLGVQDQEEDLQHLTTINEETQNPGATKNHKLSQCFNLLASTPHIGNHSCK